MHESNAHPTLAHPHSNNGNIPHYNPLTLNMIPSPNPQTPRPPKQSLSLIPTPNHNHTNLMMPQQPRRRNLSLIKKRSNKILPILILAFVGDDDDEFEAMGCGRETGDVGDFVAEHAAAATHDDDVVFGGCFVGEFFVAGFTGEEDARPGEAVRSWTLEWIWGFGGVDDGY